MQTGTWHNMELDRIRNSTEWPSTAYEVCNFGSLLSQVAGDALDRIANKLAREMNQWEKHYEIVAGIKESIIKVCKRDFELMEGQIAKIEGKLEKIIQENYTGGEHLFKVTLLPLMSTFNWELSPLSI